jgi:hypothetical protein
MRLYTYIHTNIHTCRPYCSSWSSNATASTAYAASYTYILILCIPVGRTAAVGPPTLLPHTRTFVLVKQVTRLYTYIHTNIHTCRPYCSSWSSNANASTASAASYSIWQRLLRQHLYSCTSKSGKLRFNCLCGLIQHLAAPPASALVLLYQ